MVYRIQLFPSQISSPCAVGPHPDPHPIPWDPPSWFQYCNMWSSHEDFQSIISSNLPFQATLISWGISGIICRIWDVGFSNWIATTLLTSKNSRSLLALPSSSSRMFYSVCRMTNPWNYKKERPIYIHTLLQPLPPQTTKQTGLDSLWGWLYEVFLCKS